MSEQRADRNEAPAQPVMPPANLNWGSWPLWILASLIVGGGALNYLLAHQDNVFYIFFGPLVCGTIGGVLVGFTPWLSQRIRIPLVSRWLWSVIYIFIIGTNFWLWHISNLSYLTFYLQPGYSVNLITAINIINNFWKIFFLLTFIPGLITSLLIAGGTRWACRRWLSASWKTWWIWTFAGIIVVVSIFFGVITFLFLFVLFLSA